MRPFSSWRRSASASGGAGGDAGGTERAGSESLELERRLRGIAAGRQPDAAWLYDALAARLYRRLKQRYGYPGGLEVDDLLHDTFVLVLRGRARHLIAFLERTPRVQLTLTALERYLWDQACGLASNRRRAAGFRKLVPLEEVGEPVEPSDEERRAIHADALARLVDCLRGKGQRMFLYFTFRYSDGLTPEEVSKVTGWSMKATYKLRQTLNMAVQECAERLGIAVA